MNAISKSVGFRKTEMKCSDTCPFTGMVCGNVANDIITGAPPNEYTPINLPSGYQTVLGYYVDTNPEAFDLLPDPLEDTKGELAWLMRIMGNREVPVAMVGAPKGYRDLGVSEVSIFPVELLHECIG